MNLSLDLQKLEERIGRLHLRQRLGMESDHAADLFGRGRTFFHIENWHSIHAVIRLVLRCTGLYWRGKRNALDIRIRRNVVDLPHLPAAFDGFTLLHLSDLHLDINGDCTRALIERLRAVEYDICVMTGDFRARTYGTCDTALAELARMRPHLYQPVYAILGNHDSIRMVPPMEAMGITLLMNESVAIRRGDEAIWLVGIDDPHYFRMENFDKALREVPAGSVSVLLSHSPETYRRAAHGGIDLFLCGHTHGGQICLPGGLALMTNADCPRRFCAGPWRYHGMQGYTSVGSGSSVVDVRFNCPPEITLHQLRRLV
ncbi:MAG: metallophosphoesterase [Pseudomonadota bacterium]|nr:metallophosphoesterase [Pseudomonadota bacterium]